MFFRFRSSITAKMTLLVLLGTAAVLAFVLVYSGIYSRQIILHEAEESALNLVRMVAYKLDAELVSVAGIVQNLAYAVRYGQWNEESITGLLARVVQENPKIFGSTIAFEPYQFRSDVKAYAPYFCRGGQSLQYVQLGTDSYDYFSRDWYKNTIEKRQSMWSPPYFDEGGGNILMTTYSCPIFDVNAEQPRSKIKGVITADLSLETLTGMVSAVQFKQTGYAFLVAADGAILAHPNKDFVMRESIFSVAEKLKDPTLAEIVRHFMTERSGFLPLGTTKLAREDSFLAFARLPKSHWVLGVIFPKRELFAEVTGLHETIGVLAVIGIFLLLTVSFLVARSIARPLRTMAMATRKVAEGDLDLDLSQIKTIDEVGQLSHAFEQMTDDLKKYIRELTVTTAAKQKIESELSIAATIQQSMLPSVFPAFPTRDEFDIHALMRPAKVVGGDFYDFFMLDGAKLWIVVGDVSDKGVPAALFMSVTKYLVEAFVMETPNPNEILRRVNAQLLRNNESCMFVTMVLGVLDLKTGDFLYANGGHNPLALLEADGQAIFLKRPEGPVVGIIDDATFGINKIQLTPGSTLIAYTDGITEAFNKSDQPFSEEGLLQAASQCRWKSAAETTELLLERVVSFCDGAPQADDLTILALRFNHTSEPAK